MFLKIEFKDITKIVRQLTVFDKYRNQELRDINMYIGTYKRKIFSYRSRDPDPYTYVRNYEPKYKF